MAASDSGDVDLRVRVARARQAKKDIDSVGKSVRGLGSDVEKTNKRTRTSAKGMALFTGATNKAKTAVMGLGAMAGSAALLGVGALGFAVVNATKGWAEHMGIVRRTNAVIKSTKGVAGVSAKHVENLSDALERQTGVDGDLIQSGANLLLTFTNVRNGVGKNNKVFDQATSTATNMSKALGQSTKASAIQLGKALNDPVKGVTALSKVGVSFTKDQKDQIKTLVDSGKTMDAQKIILKELGKEFPKVKATPMERMMTVVHSLQDELGKRLLPIFNKVVSKVGKFGQEMLDGTGAGGRFVAKAKALGQTLNKWIIEPVKRVVEWITKSRDRMTAVAVGFGVVTVAALALGIALMVMEAPIVLIVVAIGLIAAGFYYAYQRCELFRKIIDVVAKVALAYIIFQFKAMWAALKLVFNVVKSVVSWLADQVPPAVQKVIDAVGSIVSFVKRLPGKITAAASGIWEGLKSGLVSVINWIIGKLNLIHFQIPDWVPGLGGKQFGFNIASLSTDNAGSGNNAPARTGAGDVGLAGGGVVTRGGSFQVGERGKERVYLPPGAAVQPHGAFGEPSTTVIHLVVNDKVLATAVHKAATRKASTR